MYKHYIRTDESENIIKYFTDAFEKPIQEDVCVDEDGPRHVHLLKKLKSSNGTFNYKWEGDKIVEKTVEEIFDLDAEKEEKKKTVYASLMSRLFKENYSILKIEYEATMLQINSAIDRTELDAIQ